jgi:hypothetical protein
LSSEARPQNLFIDYKKRNPLSIYKNVSPAAFVFKLRNGKTQSPQGGQDYGAPYSNYGAGELNYGTPYSNYGAGELNYEAPYSNYGAGKLNYGAPYSNYEAGGLNYGAWGWDGEAVQPRK